MTVWFKKLYSVSSHPNEGNPYNQSSIKIMRDTCYNDLMKSEAGLTLDEIFWEDKTRERTFNTYDFALNSKVSRHPKGVNTPDYQPQKILNMTAVVGSIRVQQHVQTSSQPKQNSVQIVLKETKRGNDRLI